MAAIEEGVKTEGAILRGLRSEELSQTFHRKGDHRVSCGFMSHHDSRVHSVPSGESRLPGYSVLLSTFMVGYFTYLSSAIVTLSAYPLFTLGKCLHFNYKYRKCSRSALQYLDCWGVCVCKSQT